jgi:hypothetical protein
VARDRANINTGIWTDDDWRELTRDEQWLYELLLTHPSLTYAGVCDWRPGRLAQNSSDTTGDDIERIGALLQSKRFIFIDPDTEEVLVRSFLRHDGLLKQPKLAVSMVNAYGSISSKPIRKVVIHELQRLHGEYPEWRAFAVEKVQELLKLSGSDMATFTPGFTPPLTLDVPPADTPTGSQAEALPTSTATTTATSNPEERAPAEPTPPAKGPRGTRLPEGWEPPADVYQAMATQFPHLDLEAEHQKFTDHWRSKAGAQGVKVDWAAAWRNWIRRSADWAPKTGNRSTQRAMDGWNAMDPTRINPHTPAPWGRQEITS